MRIMLWKTIAFFLLLILQITLFPAWFADPFKPNLCIVAVVYLGLRRGTLFDTCLVYALGLVQDCFNGIYLGLNAFTYLLVYLFLRQIADRLFTESGNLLVALVFLATIASGFVQLLMLLLFYAAPGIYATLLPALIPQGVVNALVASILFGTQHHFATTGEGP